VLEVHPIDLLPFERLKSLATAVHASKVLQHFTEARRLYPDDVDAAESVRIHELLCWLIETSLQEPDWAETGVRWAPIPFAPSMLPAWVADIGGVGVLRSAEALGIEIDFKEPAASVERGFTALDAHVAPTLRDVRSRVIEILLFDTMIPHPKDEPEYADPRRALFAFGEYWDSYRSLMDQHAAAFINIQPHPMARFIASLQHRLREYSERIADVGLREALEDVLAIEFDNDSRDVWEDWVQPQINRLQHVFEELRVRQRSQTYRLTQAEELFLLAITVELADFDRQVSARWQSMLNHVPISAPAPLAETGFVEPVAGFRHSPDFRSVSLHEELFALTTQQAQVIQILLDAYRNGTPELSQAYILDRIGSDSGELRNTFRSLKDWPNLIVRGARRGTFRLNL
jgi:hypothetical protein